MIELSAYFSPCSAPWAGGSDGDNGGAAGNTGAECPYLDDADADAQVEHHIRSGGNRLVAS